MSSDAHRDAIVDAGGLAVIIAGVERHPDVAEVQELVVATDAMPLEGHRGRVRVHAQLHIGCDGNSGMIAVEYHLSVRWA